MRNLRGIAEQYRLEIGRLRIWTPYWINSDESPFRLNAPYRGKATPGQLNWATHRLIKRRQAFDQPEELIEFMTHHGLGVDCSGFVYHVLDRSLQLQGLRLADLLFIGKDEILARNSRLSEAARLWADNPVPTTMSLSQACSIWHKNPVYITNVRRLLAPRAVELVAWAKDVLPGDMIGMTNSAGEDHVGVVLEVFPDKIFYADSVHTEVCLGVSIREITIIDSESDLSAQLWEQKRLFHPECDGLVDGVWRLKGLL